MPVGFARIAERSDCYFFAGDVPRDFACGKDIIDICFRRSDEVFQCDRFGLYDIRERIAEHSAEIDKTVIAELMRRNIFRLRVIPFARFRQIYRIGKIRHIRIRKHFRKARCSGKTFFRIGSKAFTQIVHEFIGIVSVTRRDLLAERAEILRQRKLFIENMIKAFRQNRREPIVKGNMHDARVVGDVFRFRKRQRIV